MPCEGCCMSHRDLVVVLDNTKKRMSFLTDHLLLKDSVDCPTCHKPCLFNAKELRFRCSKSFIGPSKKKERCNTRISAFKGSMLFNSKVPIDKIMELIYFWLMPGSTIARVSFELRQSPTTVMQWFWFCREVTVMFCCSSLGKIGGEGAVVEIHEAEWARIKGKWENINPDNANWAIGGIESRTKKLFLVPVSDLDNNTVVEVIKNWVHPGTTIVMHCWTKERDFEIKGYDLKFAVYSVHNGRKRTYGVGYLAESFFKKTFTKQPERFHNFLIAASAAQKYLRDAKM